jgi:hypothetical protein
VDIRGSILVANSTGRQGPFGRRGPSPSVALCLCGVLAVSVAVAVAAPAKGGKTGEADRLSAQAMASCATADGVAAGEAVARKALALTNEFEPTDFVGMGRKGEVVEDEFLEARRVYRSHRARVYEAVGTCLERAGAHRAAARYLGRAALLEPSPQRALSLARALLAEERVPEAMAALRAVLRPQAVPDPEWVRVVTQAVDIAKQASVQAQLDRWRVQALAVPNLSHVEGPVRAGADARLSTGAPFAWTDEPLLLYVSPASCKDCSSHLQELARTLQEFRRGATKDAPRPEVRVIVVPEVPDQDHALRQVMTLYRYDFPVLLGRGHAAALGAPAGSVLAVARRGWSAVLVQPPYGDALATALSLLTRRDLSESLPRTAASRRMADVVARAPALPPDALAPGEDEPAPASFTAAVDAYQAGKALEAIRFLDALGADPGGWLLPPEARLDRALALAKLGDRAAARRILLRIGDSRFQADVDRVLESLPTR